MADDLAVAGDKYLLCSGWRGGQCCGRCDGGGNWVGRHNLDGGLLLLLWLWPADDPGEAGFVAVGQLRGA